MRQLKDLNFVDLYVCLEGGEEAHYKPSRREFRPGANYMLPPEYKADLEKLVTTLRPLLAENDDPALSFGDMRLRASRVHTATGQEWVALRRNPQRPPQLDTLGIDPRLVAQMRLLGQRDGLVLIAGATGHGKTTTACSLIQDYLEKNGNIAFTIEDPAEFALEGRYNNSGYCYQIEAQDDQDWAKLLKRSLRWQPQYIYVGEVRTPDAAAQLLRAATSGHLVITTIHGGSIEEALEGLLQLASAAVGPRAPQLLAAGLTAVWHQQLNDTQLRTRFYITEDGNLGDPVRSNIRAGQIGQISTYIDKQMARLGGQAMPLQGGAGGAGGAGGFGGNFGAGPNGQLGGQLGGKGFTGQR